MNMNVICAECGHFTEEHVPACTRWFSSAARVFTCTCPRFTPLSAVLAEATT